jgi:predicted PurR-regulated permease PerM
MTMKIDMETFTLLIVLAAVISVTIILSDIVRRIENMEMKLPLYIKQLSKNDNTLAKRGNVQYQKIEKLFETNARNEMEKQDEKSFINKLLSCVKMDNANITILFENTEINEAKIKDIEENITTLFKNENVYDEQKKQF